MSLLDKEEVLLDKIDKMAEDKVLWDKFHKEAIEPLLGKFLKRKPKKMFAVGVYIPDDCPFSVAQSVSSLCANCNIKCYYIDCSRINVLSPILGRISTIAASPDSLIVLDKFDEIPDSDDKKYIEHTLIKLWEKETILPRSFYGVVFVTNKDYGTNVPEQLKNIKRMLWYGNIRK